jgi:3-deoxy-manno-octulosonate cytidylyltransferase (CMP-KDO synthetase)
MTRLDHRSGTDRIVEAVRKTRLKEEIIVNLQADEPEIAPENLYRVAKLLADAPRKVAMATLAVFIHDEETWRRPNVVKVVTDATGDGAGRALYFSRAPIPFIRDAKATPARTAKDDGGASRPVFGLHHLGIYAYRRRFLLGFPKLPPSPLEETEKLEQLRVLEAGYEILVGLAEANPPGVDTPEEYEAFVERQRE